MILALFIVLVTKINKEGNEYNVNKSPCGLFCGAWLSVSGRVFFSAWGRRLFTITECINLNFISTDSLESLILGGVRKCKKAQRGDGKKLLLLFEFSTLLFHTELSFGFNMLQHVSGQTGVCVCVWGWELLFLPSEKREFGGTMEAQVALNIIKEWGGVHFILKLWHYESTI